MKQEKIHQYWATYVGSAIVVSIIFFAIDKTFREYILQASWILQIISIIHMGLMLSIVIFYFLKQKKIFLLLSKIIIIFGIITSILLVAIFGMFVVTPIIFWAVLLYNSRKHKWFNE